MQLAKRVIGSELSYFEEYFIKSLKSQVPLLDDIMNHTISHKGKQIRPLFALLSARLGGAINERSYNAALVVELLHTASLIHDDIVDESMERRGDFSVNALWNNKAAVIAGDVLSLKALLLTLTHHDYKILEIYSGAIGQIIEGEILQLRKSFQLNLDERVYYKIITAKTAGFFAAACAAGASTTFEDDAHVQRLYSFGEKVGIAFQLKDDLLDYDRASVGKPTGNDIKDKKITLPLIFTLNTCSRLLRKKLVRIIKNKNKNYESISLVIEEVNKAGGIQYTSEKMSYYRDEAIKLLYEFPESDIRLALEELVRYTTDRSY
jgi:octaprenyl-diphosphate synthase